jgi:phosphate transport system permease protein
MLPPSVDPPAKADAKAGYRFTTLPPASGWIAVREGIIETGLFLAAAFSIVITLGIVGLLLYESSLFFKEASLFEFLFTTTWSVGYENPKYGILPLVCGTLVTTGVALAVALPIGTVVAIYLSEYAPFALREVLKPVLELLSAVPTVVYGYFALQFVTPVVKALIPSLPGFNMLSAGLVMGIMIIPYVSSLSEDAMRAVPALLREGSYALGANKLTTALRVVYPAALSGIGAAYILGISRAIGETMIVLIAAGQRPCSGVDPKQPCETIAAFIAATGKGDVPTGSIEYKTIFAAGTTLFILTLIFNVIAIRFVRKYRQVYE